MKPTLFNCCILIFLSAAIASGCNETKQVTESLADHAGVNVRTPQVVVDEEMAIDAGGWQARGFSLPSPRPVQITAQGVKHTDKGFRVLLMDAAQLESFKARKEFRHIPSFEGLKIRSYSHTGELPSGSWVAVVANSENIINSMVVKLKIVVDPK
ncbi:hypothetical protein AB3662_28225 [Sorangium cellulosum]|uniref:hypothetical protein n=1 Tax=Sorangium cellulosum TaxID=56 RepID=UPI003D9A5E3A